MASFTKSAQRLALISCAAGLLAGPAFGQTSTAPAVPIPAPDPSRCKAGNQATIADCNAALVQTGDPKFRAPLLFKRAYLENDHQLYESALNDLNEALQLDPGNPGYLHERGYTLGALGRYDEAIKDLDAQIALQPDRANGYTERAFSEFPAGRFEDLLRDRNKEVELQPGDGDAVLARARAEMWLGRFDDARKDIETAADLAKQQNKTGLQKDADELGKKLTAWTTTSGAADPDKRCRDIWEVVKKDDRAFAEPNLIGDCTASFFKTTAPKARAELLTIRSVAWQFNQDNASALDDATIAVALDPDNPDLHVNLGFLYMNDEHSWAAEKQFDLAIAKKADDIAYAGRATARYNLHKYDDAFDDAKKSFELKPNELALTVLGDLALNVRHDPKSAKLYWMGAYRLGDRDDGLKARLKSIGVDDPAKEPDAPPAKK